MPAAAYATWEDTIVGGYWGKHPLLIINGTGNGGGRETRLRHRGIRGKTVAEKGRKAQEADEKTKTAK